MRIDPAGWPFVGIGVVIAALVAALAGSTRAAMPYVRPAATATRAAITNPIPTNGHPAGSMRIKVRVNSPVPGGSQGHPARADPPGASRCRCVMVAGPLQGNLFHPVLEGQFPLLEGGFFDLFGL